MWQKIFQIEMTVCVYVMSPVSAASPLLKLAPSPSCPFAPDARHTEDGHLNHTHKQKLRLYCRKLAFTGITLTWWISWAFKSNDSFLNMGAATDGAQILQSIINRPLYLNPCAFIYRRLNQELSINTSCQPTCWFLYYFCREFMISPASFCKMVLSGLHKNWIKRRHPFFDILLIFWESICGSWWKKQAYFCGWYLWVGTSLCGSYMWRG